MAFGVASWGEALVFKSFGGDTVNMKAVCRHSSEEGVPEAGEEG